MNLKVPDVHVIYEAIAERNADRPECPACRKPVWDVLNEPVILRTASSGADVHAVGMACTNCGYLRLHVANYLQ